MTIVGHHHISMYTKDAVKNKAFYTEVLGLRLVEKTVNQDNTKMYHLFYGDNAGHPGTLLTFFEIENVGKYRPGTDSIHRLTLLVPSEAALDYFKQRLDQNNVEWTSLTYVGQSAVLLKDPDELEIILIVNDHYQTPEQWSANDETDIPKDVQILGMGPVELRSRKPEALTEFLEYILGYHQRNDIEVDDNTTIMTLDEQGLYTDFVIVNQQGHRVRPGQGYVHHVAVNLPTDTDLNDIYEKIARQPNPNSGIIDRYFFKSLYYRHNQILFEFATAEPGFTVDTPVDKLSQQLNLPDFLEDKRDEIESQLREI